MSEGSNDNAGRLSGASPATPAETLDQAVDRALVLACYNAVSAQQQAWVSRQAAVNMACAGMMSLVFGSGASTPAVAAPEGGGGEQGPNEATPGDGANSPARSALRELEQLGKDAASVGDTASARKIVAFARALACLDAADMLRGAATLSTLASTMGVAKYVATGDQNYIDAGQVGAPILTTATEAFEALLQGDAA